MNWKLTYVKGSGERKVLVVRGARDPMAGDDMSMYISQIWGSLVSDFLFVPSLLKWEKENGTNCEEWAQLTGILQTEEEPTMDTTLIEISKEFVSAAPLFQNASHFLNTKISFLYVDASNYKVGTDIVVRGAVSKQQISAIMRSLEDGEFFIPEVVGIPGVRFDTPTEDDHPWFSLEDTGITLTNLQITEDLDIGTLAKRFEEAGKNNWRQPF